MIWPPGGGKRENVHAREHRVIPGVRVRARVIPGVRVRARVIPAVRVRARVRPAVRVRARVIYPPLGLGLYPPGGGGSQSVE